MSVDDRVKTLSGALFLQKLSMLLDVALELEEAWLLLSLSVEVRHLYVGNVSEEPPTEDLVMLLLVLILNFLSWIHINKDRQQTLSQCWQLSCSNVIVAPVNRFLRLSEDPGHCFSTVGMVEL
jgi:hypothetical protein